MSESTQTRKLAAILAADVSGYSRLMADNEQATVQTLTEYRRVFADQTERHRGRVVDTAGDSVLATFDSPVEAVECAVDIQRELAHRNGLLPDDRRMAFRIGINLGDVILRDDGTVYGDGVNIAARLESLAQPGGNVTGILIAPEGTLAGKKLELLREVVPKARRIALLAPDDPGVGFGLQREEVRKAAAALDVELIVVVVKGGDYAGAFAAIGAARPAALFVGAHSVFVRDRKQVIGLAAKYRLPAIYEWPQHVKDGGLMSYGASDVETYRRVAVYVDRIFKGAKPSELPIEQPSKLMLVINANTAKTLGLKLPQSLLVRADEVIQ